MQYTCKYQSPLGEIMLAADEVGLIGLWFVGQKYFAQCLNPENEEKEVTVLLAAKRWLDMDFQLPLHFIGTEFQKEVWKILESIPYGKTMTYGEIADVIAKNRGLKRMSAQAVGGAVGRNEISIIVPCHRVVGSNGSLTGYAGGIDKKIELLKLEKKVSLGVFEK